MTGTKNKGCTTVIILLQMTHRRKSIGILLINTLAYCEAQQQTYPYSLPPNYKNKQEARPEEV